MHETTRTRIHYGCERVLVMLRREGWRDDHKRVHRIYKEEGLPLRHGRPRRSRSRSRSIRRRLPIKIATAARSKIGVWRRFCNEERPHSALPWKTLAELVRKQGPQANSLASKGGEISTG